LLENAERVAMNAELFGAWSPEQFANLSPHIAHASLRELWQRLAASVWERSVRDVPVPRVLDLGAGDGFGCIPFLEMGARVTAVDGSVSPLLRLREVRGYEDVLTVVQQSAEDFLMVNRERFDIVIASSFLHHVPDYLGLISAIVERLNLRGQILFFQDPLRYDTQPRLTRFADVLAYSAWRLFEPDALGGIKRRLRRMRGAFLEDCPQDNVEYHVVRNGVDQDAVASTLRHKGLKTKVVRYWSQQGNVSQAIGEWLRLENSFAIWAMREDLDA